jgi:hypothetical protein
MLRKTQSIYNQAKRTKNWSNYKHYQTECKRQIRKAEWNYMMIGMFYLILLCVLGIFLTFSLVKTDENCLIRICTFSLLLFIRCPRSFSGATPMLSGSILFLCHINDLSNSVKSSVRLFADDCLLYRKSNNENDHTTLQNDLKILEKWMSNWGMRFKAKSVIS